MRRRACAEHEFLPKPPGEDIRERHRPPDTVAHSRSAHAAQANRLRARQTSNRTPAMRSAMTEAISLVLAADVVGTWCSVPLLALVTALAVAGLALTAAAPAT